MCLACLIMKTGGRDEHTAFAFPILCSFRLKSLLGCCIKLSLKQDTYHAAKQLSFMLTRKHMVSSNMEEITISFVCVIVLKVHNPRYHKVILTVHYYIPEGPESEKIKIGIGYFLSFKIYTALWNCGKKFCNFYYFFII